MSFTDPRKAALLILNQLAKGHSNLDRLIEEQTTGLFCGMQRRDRALANALIYGVLRWRAKLDWHISLLATQPLNRIKPEVLNILRIGLFQMMFMSRIPQSAAVNTSVEMAKEFGSKPVVRFVNGLLRNCARNPEPPAWPDPAKNPLQSLAVSQSFPQWLIKRWEKRFGMEETRRLCESFNEIPPVTLRANTLKTTKDRLLEILSQQVETIEKTSFSPHGIALHGINGPVYELSGFADGLFQIQDEAAQLAALVLAPEPGENVLDACAGLGGKSGHIAQLMENRGHVLAADSEKAKLEALESEMQRLGVRITQTRCLDLETAGEPPDMESFDRVLVDAPCSGLGVIRRNPDIKWSARKHDFDRYHQRQVRILTNAALYLKPGGILVYAVCSMEPEETGSVIEEFCTTSQDFKTEAVGKIPGVAFIDADENGYLRLFPHRHGTDGFFIAKMRRRP
ncbi:MAG: 16S rRNA (cytosine(967)-C(5))-methyltransferase RsmB [Desulfobacteraceae bacterium]|nr:16S rRNA (cytosine(967)-C(5))-methyltransferase RsmB [Desulfobacteraceae bacterium]